MRKMLLLSLLLSLAVYGCKDAGSKQSVDSAVSNDGVVATVSPKEVASSIEQLVKSTLAGNPEYASYAVKANPLVEVKELIGYYFVNLIISDGNGNEVNNDYLITNGRYIVPDFLDMETGLSFTKVYKHDYGPMVDIDVSELTMYFGNKDSKNIIVKISDFECQYCANLNEELKKSLEGMEDDVALYMMHFPLRKIHPKAEFLAVVFESLAQLGEAAKYKDELFEREIHDMSETEITEHFAKKVSDPDRFRELVEGDEMLSRVLDAEKRVMELGIRSTPVLFINGKRLDGADGQMLRHGLKALK